MITLRMLLAILFLLGCSASLAAQPGFVPFPSFSGGGIPAPSAHGLLEVPDLQHMRWSDARAQAEKAGFRLVSVTGQTEGLVVGQNPKAHEKATKDSTLEVRMELLTTTVTPAPSPTATPNPMPSWAAVNYTPRSAEGLRGDR